MRLRSKLFLAQLPLIVALVVTGVVGSTMILAVGRSSDLILRENYRSVLAAQRMKESAERIDSAALFAVAGHREQGARQIASHIGTFELELAVEHDNITETGERKAAAQLSALCK